MTQDLESGGGLGGESFRGGDRFFFAPTLRHSPLLPCLVLSLICIACYYYCYTHLYIIFVFVIDLTIFNIHSEKKKHPTIKINFHALINACQASKKGKNETWENTDPYSVAFCKKSGSPSFHIKVPLLQVPRFHKQRFQGSRGRFH